MDFNVLSALHEQIYVSSALLCPSVPCPDIPVRSAPASPSQSSPASNTSTLMSSVSPTLTLNLCWVPSADPHY